MFLKSQVLVEFEIFSQYQNWVDSWCTSDFEVFTNKS